MLSFLYISRLKGFPLKDVEYFLGVTDVSLFQYIVCMRFLITPVSHSFNSLQTDSDEMLPSVQSS